jgi:hypothetical protein
MQKKSENYGGDSYNIVYKITKRVPMETKKVFWRRRAAPDENVYYQTVSQLCCVMNVNSVCGTYTEVILLGQV